MDWSEIVDNPYLRDLPFKIEQDRYGNILMSPASNRHAELQAEIAYLLRKLKPEGRSLTECSVATPEGVKSPDVAWADEAFVVANRMTTPFQSAPAICVEVLSPSNSKAEIAMKAKLYFDAGAAEVWVCDNEGRFNSSRRPARSRNRLLPLTSHGRLIEALAKRLLSAQKTRPGDSSPGRGRWCWRFKKRQASLDEQHLLVGWQRPEVVGHDRLQLVGVLADLEHRRQDLVAALGDVLAVVGRGLG